MGVFTWPMRVASLDSGDARDMEAVVDTSTSSVSFQPAFCEIWELPRVARVSSTWLTIAPWNGTWAKHGPQWTGYRE